MTPDNPHDIDVYGKDATALWTADNIGTINPDGSVSILPKTDETSAAMRREFVRKALDYNANLDARTLDGKKVVAGLYSQEVYDLCTGGDPRHAEWKDPHTEPYANITLPKPE